MRGKKYGILFAAAITAALFAAAPVLAMDYNPDAMDNEDADSRVKIDVTVKSPDDTEQTINVYFDDESYVLISGQPQTVMLEPDKVYQVKAESISDVYSAYQLEYKDTLDTSKETSFTINVVQAETQDPDTPAPSLDGGEAAGENEGADDTVAYDFADGTAAGTVHVQVPAYDGISSVTYSLYSGDRMYDIELNPGNGFEAYASIPAGNYTEKLDSGISLFPGVKLKDTGARLYLRHSGGIEDTGKAVAVTEGAGTEIQGLKVFVYSDSYGEREFTSQETAYANAAEGQDFSQHLQEISQKLNATEPEVAARQESGRKAPAIAAIAAVGAVCVIVAMAFALLKKQRK